MKFAEFFAGIGLVRLGLEKAGWTCVFANDLNRRKAEIYEKNFGSSDLMVGDISEVQALHLPAFDVATASFPCQDLSLAGKREGLLGKRSGTFHEFVRILREAQQQHRLPQVVILENVAGLLTSHQGQDMSSILKTLNSLDYLVDILVINSSRFLPQSRVRVFIIGIQGSRIVTPNPHDTETALKHELRGSAVARVFQENLGLKWGFLSLPDIPNRSTLSLDNIIEPTSTYFDKARLEKELSYVRDASRLRLDNAIKVVNQTGQTEYLTGFRRMRKNLVSLELRNDGIAGCLRAVTGGSSKQILIKVEPYSSVEMRYMTAREYGRLQGAPDDFWIPDNQVTGLHAFGDAVSVPVLEWLGNAISHALTENALST